jgi:arylsulfatase A-like enzyme
MDHQVGRIVDYIRSSEKFADNTIIVFFSDHGLMTGDHGLKHKSTLFQEVLNPSLIINYPKNYKTKTIETPVELLDLGKTVIDIAGANEAAMNSCPNGYSLLPLLTGKGKYERKGVAFGEIEFYQAAVGETHKLIDSDVTAPILFNYSTDNKEIKDRSKQEPEKVKALQSAVDKWIEQTGEIKPAEYLKGRNNNKKKNKLKEKTDKGNDQ